MTFTIFPRTDKKFLAFFFRRIKPNVSGRYEKEFPFISPCGPETNYIRCDDLPIVFTHLMDQHGKVIEDIASHGQTENSVSSSNDYKGGDEVSIFRDDTIGLKDTISRELCGADVEEIYLNSKTADFEMYSRNTEASDVCSEQLSYGGTGNILTLPFHPEKLCMLPDSGRVYHAGPAHLGSVGLVKSSLAIELSHFFVYEEGANENHPPVAFRWRGKTWELDSSILKCLNHGESPASRKRKETTETF